MISLFIHKHFLCNLIDKFRFLNRIDNDYMNGIHMN